MGVLLNSNLSFGCKDDLFKGIGGDFSAFNSLYFIVRGDKWNVLNRLMHES